ncbi:DUF6053 domain-containing protein [Lysobacter enzymogenes]
METWAKSVGPEGPPTIAAPSR